jgi:hypothetical protein
MAGLADEVIYCDLRMPRSWKQQALYDSTPQIRFLRGDVRDKIEELPVIHILFYRRDSLGEGGSGVYILGKQWLGRILQHFPEHGGLIITDGSNSENSIFTRMIRADGYTRKQWQCLFRLCHEQPWFDTYGLYTIEVTKITQQEPGAEAD